MAFEKIEAISAEDAAPHLAKCARLGGYSVSKLVECGQAYRMTTEGGEGVFILSRDGAVCWVAAAEGAASEDLTHTGVALIELMAKEAGCKFVGFKTRRAGLVKKASRLGYAVDQIHMKKAIT